VKKDRVLDAYVFPALDVHIIPQRIVALFIDSLLLSLLMFFVNVDLGSIHIIGDTVPDHYIAIYSVAWPWYFVAVFAYFFLSEMLFSTTIGKRAMGLMVVDLAGQRITLRAALLRNLFRLLDVIPGCYLVGGVCLFLMPDRCRCGDLVARTQVVRRSSVLEPIVHIGGKERLAAFVCGLLLFACLCYGYVTRPLAVIHEMAMTKSFLFIGNEGNISALKPGKPIWGGDAMTVTYPVTYQNQRDGHDMTCHDVVVLHFHPFMGWQPSSGSSGNCHTTD
jgi:uncharacterized RDD family membrane protein YckC